MAWGMSKTIQSIPELWKAFVLDVIDSNQSAEQNGWRWLCALCYLLDNNSMSSKELQKKLPVGHPLKSARTHTNLLEPLATQLKKDLGNLTKISEIDFSGVEFENDINFSNFIFPVKTNFSNTTFLKDALFSDAIFLDTALFKIPNLMGNVPNLNLLFLKRWQILVMLHSSIMQTLQIQNLAGEQASKRQHLNAMPRDYIEQN